MWSCSHEEPNLCGGANRNSVCNSHCYLAMTKLYSGFPLAHHAVSLEQTV